MNVGKKRSDTTILKSKDIIQGFFISEPFLSDIDFQNKIEYP